MWVVEGGRVVEARGKWRGDGWRNGWVVAKHQLAGATVDRFEAVQNGRFLGNRFVRRRTKRGLSHKTHGLLQARVLYPSMVQSLWFVIFYIYRAIPWIVACVWAVVTRHSAITDVTITPRQVLASSCIHYRIFSSTN